MADAVAVLPIISFGLLVATFHHRLDLGLEPGHTRDWRVAWLTASVAWGLAVLLIVELSSAARLLSCTTLLACWTALAAALAVVRWGRHAGRRQLDGVTKAPRGGWLTESTLDLLLMAFVMIIVTTLAALAVIAPPNNWDSQTYHMARVAHWIQNGSVNHYPTTIARQLYLGPWSEFAVLQFQMIAGSDRWANLVQWMAMVGSAIGASLVTERLGGARSAQLCAAAVTIAIPMGILQATSTQTDYVTAFWVLTFVYYALLMMDPAIGPRRPVVVLAGLSLGLGIVTKATTSVFALPFVIWLLLWAAREWVPRRIAMLMGVGVIALSLSIGHVWRNWTTFGHPLGPSTDLMLYSNEIRTPAAVASNVVRNIGLHLPTPVGAFNRVSMDSVQRLHSLIGIDVNDPRTSYNDPRPQQQFDISKPRYHEDLAGNFLHAALMLLAIGVILIRPGRGGDIRRAFALALVAGFVLFCIELKWQPWGSRLQLPLFVLGAPLIAITFWHVLRPNMARVAALLAVIAALPWVLFNESRPLVPKPTRRVLWNRDAPTVFNTSRREMYFMNRPELAQPYQEAAAQIERRAATTSGW